MAGRQAKAPAEEDDDDQRRCETEHARQAHIIGEAGGGQGGRRAVGGQGSV